MGVLDFFKGKKNNSLNNLPEINVLDATIETLADQPHDFTESNINYDEPTAISSQINTSQPMPPEPFDRSKLFQQQQSQVSNQQIQQLKEQPSQTTQSQNFSEEPEEDQDAQGITKVEDEHASFEVPDFSEEDLSIDITAEDMAHETHVTSDSQEDLQNDDFTKEVEKEEPVEEVKESEDFTKEVKKEIEVSAQSDEDDDDEELPKFEIVPPPMLTSDTFSEELPTFTKGSTPSKSNNKIKEIFVEKEDYIEILSREEEVNSEIKHIKSDLNKLLIYSAEEEKIYNSLGDVATAVKEALLLTDSKLFER